MIMYKNVPDRLNSRKKEIVIKDRWNCWRNSTGPLGS